MSGIAQAPAGSSLPSPRQLLRGTEAEPAELVEVRAGPLRGLLGECELRRLEIAGLEVVTRLLFLVRSDRWETVPVNVREREAEIADRHFRVECRGDCEWKDIAASWSVEIAGGPDGTVEYAMRLVPESGFPYNRLGICVLLSPSLVGARYRYRAPDGPGEGFLPRAIAPQVFDDGVYRPMTRSFSEIGFEAERGVRVDLRFEGDLFEIEDHRNWSDASFKTYSNPITLGFPHRAAPGEAIEQRVRIAAGAADPATPARRQPVRIAVGGTPLDGGAMPAVGFGLPSEGGAPDEVALPLLRALGASHLRLAIDSADPLREQRLREGLGACGRLGCGLELALTVHAASLPGLPELLGAAAADRAAPLARLIVLGPAGEVTAAPLVRLVRRMLAELAPGVPVLGGTDHFFTEINRRRPELDGTDGFAFSLNPQIHADDDLSMFETLAMQAEIARNARAIAGGAQVAITPVTLKMRQWVYGEDPRGDDELPFPVDPRQMSLLGAAWTLGSLKYLCESPVDSLTYYEAVGWRGLLERSEGCRLPGLFPSLPGMAFPCYHVFADLAGLAGGALRNVGSSEPRSVVSMAAEVEGGIRLLLANLTADPQSVAVAGLPTERPAAMRRLNLETAAEAMLDPGGFRASEKPATEAAEPGELVLELAPYEYLSLG